MGRKRRSGGEAPREAGAPAAASGRRALPAWLRPLAGPLLLAALLLAGTAEKRLFGVISDEQQALFTAVSLSESAEIGIARGQLFSVHRPAGDAVSPYGMGLPLLETLPAKAAWAFERSFGPGSSQALFVLLQLLLVLAASGAAGALALVLGASPAGAAVALLGTAVGSPLWAYVGSGFSEPLQAAALAGGVLAAACAARAPSSRRGLLLAAAAGGAAGAAVLAKSLNAALLPLVLLPLVLDGEAPRSERLRRIGASAAGGAVPLGAWLAFEMARFGAPFAAYGGQSFSHPFLDGLWRLAVGPNKGLLLYFPLLALAAAGCARLAAKGPARGSAAAVAGVSLSLLGLSAAWWAWDGTVGWGPRLLLPAVPLLAAAAGAAMPRTEGSTRGAGPVVRVGRGLVVLGALANLPGILTSPAAASRYVASLPGRVVAGAEAAGYPAYYLETDAEGRAVLPRPFYAASQAHLNPVRVHLFLFGVRAGGGTAAERTARLEAPPWLAEHRGDRPVLRSGGASASAAALDYLLEGFSWPHLAAGTSSGGATPFLDAVADQVLREIDLGRPARAVALSERLLSQAPSPYAAALHAESLRAAGRREGLAAFLAGLPPGLRTSPSLGVVEALSARDSGDEKRAREVLGQVARVLSRPAIAGALGSPLALWPANLHGMTGENLADRTLGRPGLGGRS